MSTIATRSLDSVKSLGSTDEKATAIINAARETFLSKGFDAASMDQIALTAGVSKRTVYNRFRSKEELFTAAIMETCGKLLPVNLEDIAASLPPEEFIRQVGRHFLEGILAPESLALRRIAAFEAQRTPSLGKAYLHHGPIWMVEVCTAPLERLTSKGFLTITDPKTAIWQLGALLMEPLYTEVLMGVYPDDLDAAINGQIETGLTAFMKIYGAA